MTTSEDQYKTTFIIKWGTFMWLVMPFKLKNGSPTYQQTVNMAFKEYFDVSMKLFLDDFNVFNDLKTHLTIFLILLQQKLKIRY
jgi:hypothetical protein